MNITGEVLTALIGIGSLISIVIGIWVRLEGRIREAEKAAAEAVKELRRQVEQQNEARTDEIIITSKDLSDYKLHAAEQFASNTHLKDVETRLTGAIDRLTNRIEMLPTKLAEEFARIAGK